jgi:hypothetical protein
MAMRTPPKIIKQTPAEYVIALLGGGSIRKTARLLGCDPSRICQMKKHGGKLSNNLQRRFLEIANELGVPLSAEILILGVRE